MLKRVVHGNNPGVRQLFTYHAFHCVSLVFVVTHTVGIPVTHPDPDSLKMQNEEVFDITSLCSFKLLQRRSSVAGSLHSADAYSHVWWVFNIHTHTHTHTCTLALAAAGWANACGRVWWRWSLAGLCCSAETHICDSFSATWQGGRGRKISLRRDRRLYWTGQLLSKKELINFFVWLSSF